MTKKYWIAAVDPGLHGACALLDEEDGVIALFDTPTYVDEKGREHIYAIAMHDILHQGLMWNTRRLPIVGVVEGVHARPKDGGSSGFKFGVTKGVAIGVLSSFCHDFVEPSPSVWKRAMGVTANKRTSLARAADLFPDMAGDLTLVKHNDRAEALLMARYVRQTHSFTVN